MLIDDNHCVYPNWDGTYWVGKHKTFDKDGYCTTCGYKRQDEPPAELTAMLYALDRIFADSQTRANKSKELTVDEAHKEFFAVHVIGPLGEAKCPKCGSEDVEKRGSWDWGPFYWQCDLCSYQWGHA